MLEENPAVDPDLSRARATLEAYAPRDEEQARFRTDLIAWIDEHPEDAHRRSCLEGHLTASVLLVDHTRERVLLHHHRKLDRWLQFGGHCDGDGEKGDRYKHNAGGAVHETSPLRPSR